MKELTNKYFNESGCLTLEALEKYLNNELDGDDFKIINNHLKECELCSDALEGLELVKDKEKLNSMISEINENLNSKLKSGNNVRKMRSDKLFYYSAAAVIIILFGLFSYFKFGMKKNSAEMPLYAGNSKVEMPLPKLDIKPGKKIAKQKESGNIENEKLQYITINIKDIELDDLADEELEISLENDKPISKTSENKEMPDADDGYLIDMVVINSDANIGSGPSAPPGHILPDNEQDKTKRDLSEKVDVINKEFTVVETMPGFPGGETGLRNYLKQNLKYPHRAREKGVEGKIYISFIINTSGQVTNVEVLKGIDPECDEEAVRIVKGMPEWEPGRQQGKPVNVRFVLPIYFKLYI